MNRAEVSEWRDPSGGIQAEESEWMYPSRRIRVEGSERRDPSGGIQAKGSEWRDPSGGIQVEGYDRGSEWIPSRVEERMGSKYDRRDPRVLEGSERLDPSRGIQVESDPKYDRHERMGSERMKGSEWRDPS